MTLFGGNKRTLRSPEDSGSARVQAPDTLAVSPDGRMVSAVGGNSGPVTPVSTRTGHTLLEGEGYTSAAEWCAGDSFLTLIKSAGQPATSRTLPAGPPGILARAHLPRG